MACGRFCLYSVGVVFLAIILKLFLTARQLAHDQPYYVLTTHSAHVNPPAVHSRYRGPEYRNVSEVFFFQWWNFLVFDADTRDHFNLIYQVSNFADGSPNQDLATVSMMHLRGSQRVLGVTDAIPMSQLTVSNDFDLEYQRDGRVVYAQKIIDANTYRLTAHFDAQMSTTYPGSDLPAHVPVSWDLTFHRVHGVYTNEDTENDNKNKDMCIIVSTLFGYNSEVEGTFTYGSKVFKIARTPRYRAYSAGSFGCDLPNGSPPVEYPWSWFWLVVPGANPKQDIGMVFGTARFQKVGPLTDLLGGFGAVGMEDGLQSMKFAKLLHNSSLEFPLQASSSDGYFSKYKWTYGNWAQFQDEDGTAMIPLNQYYHAESQHFSYQIDWYSTIDQYFRAPVLLEKNFALRVFSDFRAVGVKAHVTIKRKAQGMTPESVIFDNVVDTMNALEFAYEAPVDLKRFKHMTAS